MCGLATIARFGNGRADAVDDRVLRRMTDVLTHRGPDDTRHLRRGSVGLSFTRLSLVDPEGGGQPLLSPDGSVALIANGEIYNHRELAALLPAGTRMQTDSDCEVLVHLYQQRGLDFLRGVRGMFSIILHDRNRNRLVLARDRFGVKPLFYHLDRERIIASSEIKALFEDPHVPRELDWKAAVDEQLFSSEPYFSAAPATSFFAGIETVAANGLLTVNLADGRVEAVAGRDSATPEVAPVNPETAYDEYFSLLQTAVDRTLMADVELGLFLSGGVDSAVVAALVGPRYPLHCFTVATASTLQNGDVEHAFRTAQHLGHPHHQVAFPDDLVPTPAEWKSLLWLTETPLCGPEQWFKFQLHRFARRTAPDVKAMLLGAAADEYTGGYSTLFSPDGTWAGFESALQQMAARTGSRGEPGAATWAGSSLLHRDLIADRAAATDPYQMFVDWKLRDVNQYNCWHEDRTAAGNGIEARVPFLDEDLVNFVAGVRRSDRADLLWDKHLLREAVRRQGILPEDIVLRPKEPFYDGRSAGPTHRQLRAMLRQDGHALVEEATSAGRAGEYLNAEGIRRTLADLEAGRPGEHVEILLRVVNLGLLEAMLADLPAPLPTVPVGPHLVALQETTWAGQEAEARRILTPEREWGEAVVELADDTFLVQRTGSGPYYVVQGGELRFVLDPDGDAAMLALLDAVDGVRPVREVAAGAAVPPAEAEELARTALASGVLAEVAVPAPVPVPVPV